MYNLFNLIRIQLFTNFKINKLLKKKKGAMIGGFASLILFGLFFAFIFGFVGYTYAEISYERLSLYGKTNETISLMLAYCVLISFFFSFYAVPSVLYNFKDYDILISMPIKKREIVLSKIAYVYITDILLDIFVLTGAIIKTYSLLQLDIIFIAKVLLAVIVSPFFAITVSLIIGTVFSLISSRFIKKNVAQIILYVLFILAILFISFIGGIEYDVTKIISKIFFLYPWLNIALNENFIYFLYFALVSVLPFIIVTSLICKFFEKLNTLMNAKKRAKNFKLKNYKVKGEFKTMFQKEVKRLFSSPIYIMNTLFGTIMGVIFSIVILIVFSSIKIDLDFSALTVYLPMIVFFCFLMSPTTNCSISMEGKSYWVYKTLPITSSAFFGSKLAVNYVINVPAALISSICLSFALRLKIGISLLFILLSLLTVIFAGLYGLFLNVFFPNLKWENENQAVKQGIAVLINVFTAFFIVGIYFVINYFVSALATVMFVSCIAVFLIFNVILCTFVFRKGQKVLDKKI